MNLPDNGNTHPQVAHELKPGLTVTLHDNTSRWAPLAAVPIHLSAAIPIRAFKIKDLVSLRPGQTLTTAWPSSEDVPLATRGTQLAWAEFEVIDKRMALRLTRLA